jgi:hypothetical protein
MLRPAALRFGLLACALSACGGGRGAAQGGPIGNRGGTARAVTGSYACAIEDAGYRYPPFHCVIKRTGERLDLVKLDGSQRFEGEVREGADGLQFVGRFYCPFGDCTQELHGVFAPSGAGGWKGTFRDAKFVVWMAPAEAGGAFGGQGYGGAGYGGAMVGAPASN